MNDFRWWSMHSMGNMKECRVLGIRFGREPWFALRPGKMWTAAGRCYKPLILGFWKRAPEEDKLQ